MKFIISGKNIEVTPGLKDAIEYRRIYSVDNFSEDYNSLKGSALGLAHNLCQ